MSGGAHPIRGLLRLAVTAAVLLAATALVILLWGPKCAPAILFGLALGIGFVGAGASSPPGLKPDRSDASDGPYSYEVLTPLLGLAVALALAQWLRHALPLASFSRAEKVHVLTWAVGGLIVAVLVADYAGRFIESRAKRQGAAT